MKDIIPASARAVVYRIFAILGIALGAIQVGIGAVGAELPAWFAATWAVYAFVGGAIGFTALANTPKKGDHEA